MSTIAKSLGLAVIALMIGAGLGIVCSESGHQLVMSVLNPRTETPPRPQVLVFAANHSDQLSVITTVEPRGYDVVLASNIEAAIHALGYADEEQLRILVIDPTMPNSSAILRCVKAAYPDTRILMVDPNQSSVNLARQLLNAIA
jgi:hypothetical protein